MMMNNSNLVIARSESDEAIQKIPRVALDCFAFARNDGNRRLCAQQLK